MKTQKQTIKNTIHNLIIFTIAVLSIGWIGHGLDVLLDNPSSESLGMLLWIITPLGACLLLRGFAGDGWKDFGIKPKFKGNLIWYAVSILIFPVITGLILAIGKVSGFISFPNSLLETPVGFLPVFALALIPGFFKNIFEESAWRGYLTPRVFSLNLNDYAGHIIVGLIWALWHVPYYLYFLNRTILRDYTTLNMAAFIPLALLTIVAYSFAFGEIRLLTGSIWPAVLMHAVEDALVNPLIIEEFIKIKPDMDIIFSPGVSILAIGFFALSGIFLRKLRIARAQRQSLS
ncbi:MAG: CPBP family intramembrane metalloprotease [candidate division WOR-3 bacterium]